VHSADLDEAVWAAFTQKVALRPEYNMGPVQRTATESEQRLEQVARQGVAIEHPWPHWARETAYLLRLGGQTRIAPDQGGRRPQGGERRGGAPARRAGATGDAGEPTQGRRVERICERLRAAGGTDEPAERTITRR
jgi:hypothetical protein